VQQLDALNECTDVNNPKDARNQSVQLVRNRWAREGTGPKISFLRNVENTLLENQQEELTQSEEVLDLEGEQAVAHILRLLRGGQSRSLRVDPWAQFLELVLGLMLPEDRAIQVRRKPRLISNPILTCLASNICLWLFAVASKNGSAAPSLDTA
jgi:hypothetical protein